MQALVNELRQVIQQANLPPPYVLVGHSFGGLVVRAFARAHREQVAGLVFVDPLHPEEWCRPSAEQRRMLRGGVFLSRVGAVLARLGIVRFMLSRLSGGSPTMPRRVSRIFGAEAAALLARMVDEVQKLPPDVLPAVQEHWSNPKSFRGMWQHLRAVPGCSAEVVAGTDTLDEIPVVVLSAERRDPRWVAADAALARLSKHGRHIMSARSGHWVHLDDPALVVDVLRDMVVQLRSPARQG
jgi:pimeloyl-ACP methyl ester carboxylesterase